MNVSARGEFGPASASCSQSSRNRVASSPISGSVNNRISPIVDRTQSLRSAQACSAPTCPHYAVGALCFVVRVCVNSVYVSKYAFHDRSQFVSVQHYAIEAPIRRKSIANLDQETLQLSPWNVQRE